MKQSADEKRMEEMPALPHSWSELSWQQMHMCWEIKQRYGGNAAVARCAALLSMIGLSAKRSKKGEAEKIYILTDKDGREWTVTPRILSYLAKKAIPWFDYPYGDQGEEEEKDEKGNITKQQREPVTGYVSNMRDALILPVDNVKIGHRHFSLPQMACVNITWQQYRALQAIVPMLFTENTSEEQAIEAQARFLANSITPRSIALFDNNGGSIRFRIHYEYSYNAAQAEGLEKWIMKKMKKERKKGKEELLILFHICFQMYQTAMNYYSTVFAELFGKGDKSGLNDAIRGEIGTLNAVMKYAGYAEQQQVYDSNLPFILDILNTMTKEANEIKKINSKIKKK